MNWREMPFIRLLLPLLLGMVGSLVFDSAVWSDIITGIICLSFIGMLFVIKRTPVHPFSPYFGMLLSIFLFSFGLFRCFQYNELSLPSHFKHHHSANCFYLVKVKKLSKRSKKIRLETQVNLMASEDKDIRKVSGNLLVYLPTDSLSLSLTMGDHIILKSNPIPLVKPKNPEAFDIAHFFHLKNIHYQTFTEADDWAQFSKDSKLTLQEFFALYQLKAVAILRKHLPQEREFAVAAALIVGFREAVSTEVRELYANTGAIHVLAVSGLHLGFIYFGVYWFFTHLFGNRSHWVWLRVLSCLIILWSFALFTGGAASVLRAATMLSFVLLGQSLGRFCNIYNSLAASAFILLCIKPFFLWEIGFQLSYLAVLGIVFFHPVIYPCLYFQNRPVDWLWKLTAVSLAAQISTFPLSLYYFHQFPALFWLSGWLVVSFAGLILGLGLALLLCSQINLLAQGVAGMLFGAIYIVNYSLTLVQKIPGSLWEKIWIDSTSAVLIYLVIICMAWTIKSRKMGGLCFGFSLGLLMVLHLAWHKWTIYQQRQITIYHIPNGSAIDFFDSRQAFVLKTAKTAAETIDYYSKNYRLSKGIHKVYTLQIQTKQLVEYSNWYYHQTMMQFFDCRLAILNKRLPSRAPPSPLRIDYLLLQDSPDVNISDLKQYYKFHTLIMDGSNNWKSIKRWESACQEQGIVFVNTRKTGACTIKLSKR